MKKIISALLFLVFFKSAVTQKIVILTKVQSSLRGLGVVSDHVLWASGSRGMVGRSVDGGKTWQWTRPQGFEDRDFRDIEAFDKNTAVIMAVDRPAAILRTENGGKSWSKVYENDSAGMFLDAMSFADEKHGIVVGDPVGGRFFVASTSDGGKTWTGLPWIKRPLADSGEACFASSGTNVIDRADSRYFFVSGGRRSHFIDPPKRYPLPLLQGMESTGANSVASGKGATLVAVGGNFLRENDNNGTCALSVDGGKTWTEPSVPPSGYRSCVAFLSGSKWITCGLNGVDISVDNGETWKKISGDSFNVCRKAKKGEAVFFAGSAGKIARWNQ